MFPKVLSASEVCSANLALVAVGPEEALANVQSVGAPVFGFQSGVICSHLSNSPCYFLDSQIPDGLSGIRATTGRTLPPVAENQIGRGSMLIWIFIQAPCGGYAFCQLTPTQGCLCAGLLIGFCSLLLCLKGRQVFNYLTQRWLR